MAIAMWQRGSIPQEEWKEATTIKPPKKTDRTECGKYRGILLVAHAGRVLRKGITIRLIIYCEREKPLPEEECCLRPQRSAIDIIFLVRRLHQIP